MSDEHAIGVVMGKPQNSKIVDVNHSSRFIFKHKSDAIRIYGVNNQKKHFLLTIKKFKKVFSAVQC